MHERYSVVVDFYFLHVAQLNQTSYAKHLPSNTDLCAVFKKKGVLCDKPHEESTVAWNERALLTGDWGFTVSYFFFFSPEKLSHAKEENLGMHQVLDQTLQELNSL